MVDERVVPEGENEGSERWDVEKPGVEIYGSATDASPKDDIFLSVRI